MALSLNLFRALSAAAATAHVNHVMMVHWRRRRHVDDALLPELDLLDAVRREEPGLVGPTDKALQQAAIRRADHLDYVPGLDLDVAGKARLVALHADDGGARVANRAGRRIRVGSDAGRVADDVARVAETFVWNENKERGKDGQLLDVTLIDCDDDDAHVLIYLLERHL